MAKKKKKISPLVKAKRRYRRNKSRLDMRKGGRVGFQIGGSGEGTGGGPDEEELRKAFEDPNWASKFTNQGGQKYAYDPHAAQSIDPTRRTWTPITQQTQWNLDPNLQTFGYNQAVASGMKPPTPRDPDTGILGGQIGPKIKEWWKKDKKGNNLVFNVVTKTWDLVKDVVNPFDGSYPIANLVKQTGETLIPGGENPLADWFNKQAPETTGTAAGAQAQEAAVGNINTPTNTPVVNTPVTNQPIPPLTQAQQQAQDLAIQQQIAADQAAIQQAGGSPSQAGTTTVGTTTGRREDEYDELPRDDDDTGGPPEGWWTEHGYNSEEEAILSGDFIWDAETKSFVLKGGGTGGGTGGGDNAGLTFPEGLPEGGQFAYDVARGERKIAPDAVKVGGYLTNEDGTVATYPIGHPQVGEPIPLTPDMDETTMAALTDEQKAKAGKAEVDLYKKDAQGNILRDDKGAPIPVSAVATADDAAVAKKITDVEASTYDEIERILTSPTVTAQESTFKEEMKAVIDEIVGVKKADGVTIDDEEAASALAKDLQGELSDGAMAKAVSISGANLSRVLRAKKQLRKAGLSEDIITELGDNPDDLEDRLDEFTEAERGVVAGLPEEALVSNQLDTLLTGIENGEVPTWAQPAVAAVNQMMAERGLDASTVGRDNLFNAIIQSAVPLAQQNAQAIQATFTQTRELESRATIAQAQINQQTALDHANKTFQMDMANFNEDQTRNLANSKWLQTVELTNASMEQQAAVQEAANLANLDLATLSTRERLAVNNAKSFLQLDMTNLTNRQQSEVLTDQMEMQKLLSNQSAENARLQFNAQSENQVNTFMANLANQVELNNAQRIDATKQFNATQKNAAIARREGIEADVAKINAQLVTQVNQFNAQQDFERNKWNATNQAMVEQSNVEWRRKSNTINTAAQNQINMQNAMNAFKISGASLSNYWQQLRDEAAYDFKAVENAENRLAQILSTAIANEGEIAKKEYWDSHVDEFKTIYDTWFGGS